MIKYIFQNEFWLLYVPLFGLLAWFAYQTYTATTSGSDSVNPKTGEKKEYGNLPFYKVSQFWYCVAMVVVIIAVTYWLHLER